MLNTTQLFLHVILSLFEINIVAIGYDFLANDFSLKVKDTAGNVIAEGEPAGLVDREDYFNFYYLIFAGTLFSTPFV